MFHERDAKRQHTSVDVSHVLLTLGIVTSLVGCGVAGKLHFFKLHLDCRGQPLICFMLSGALLEHHALVVGLMLDPMKVAHQADKVGNICAKRLLGLKPLEGVLTDGAHLERVQPLRFHMAEGFNFGGRRGHNTVHTLGRDKEMRVISLLPRHSIRKGYQLDFDIDKMRG